MLKSELDEIYDKITAGVRVRSRCQHYEEGEKSIFTKFGKSVRFTRKVSKLIVRNHDITDDPKIEHEIFFSTRAFSKTRSKRRYLKRQTF